LRARPRKHLKRRKIPRNIRRCVSITARLIARSIKKTRRNAGQTKIGAVT
jgi:hypothetical protein